MRIIDNPIELAKKLVSINSETGKEAEISKFIFDYLFSLGFKPYFQQIEKSRANVYLIGKGEVMFNGHMDTVPAGKNWKQNPIGEIKNGKLFGRGSCDTKGSIACFLSALAKIKNKNISCSFTIGEENTFLGIKNLMKLRDKELKKIKYCVNLEPTELKLVTAHKGRIVFIVETSGKSAHGSVPEQGENAILKMNKAITVIEKFNENLRRVKHPLLGNSTLNIGKIEGGTEPNIVPDYAKIEIDIRILPNQNIKKLIEEFSKISQPAKTKIFNIYNPVELDARNSFVKKFQKILRLKNLNPQPIGVFYTTEFSEIAKYNIQGFIFGAGSIDQAHKTDEYAKIEELKLCHEIFKNLLKEI